MSADEVILDAGVVLVCIVCKHRIYSIRLLDFPITGHRLQSIMFRYSAWKSVRV